MRAPSTREANPVIREQLAAALRDELAALGVDAPTEVHLEQPARREHGDWSTNIALASAKAAARPPRELAAELAERLNAASIPHVERVEIAGPGFVNFHLAPTWLHEVARRVIDDGEEGFARLEIGRGRRAMVEFVSANPTGPLHAGHARGAVFGDALARLLERVGYVVAREFYINDRGTQMAKMGHSIAARARGESPLEDGYHGAYITEWAADLPLDADPIEHGYAKALQDQRETLALLGVVFDHWFSEREMVESGAIAQTLTDLADRGVTYEADGATWLRSTDFGDDKDRVLVKSDGEFTYLLPDIAYHRDKFGRGFDLLIDVWGADHHGYVPRMRAALSALGHGADQFDVAITQMVRLLRDGDEVKISKRSGQLIELREIVDELGSDATRLVYLQQSVDSPQSVDLAVMLAQSMENPVFYVQMAHARLCSIRRVAAERGIERCSLAETDLGPLRHERELEVLRTLNNLPSLMEIAARDHAPHKVASWVRELAGAVHGWYHDCPVLRDDVDDQTRQARLWLADAALVGLRVGLSVLGASAPTSM
ncbi:MAG: arginine--tRNA ligase [Microthrixaceae bacterium]|nr:arginine--tRNA ligase [Microthrixaceae bacterium]